MKTFKAEEIRQWNISQNVLRTCHLLHRLTANAISNTSHKNRGGWGQRGLLVKLAR